MTPSEPSPTGTESPFKGTPLDGMSPAQIAARFSTLEGTVKEQGRELNRRARADQNRPPATPPPTEPELEYDSTTFFSDPNKVLKDRDARLRKQITDDMKEIISPFAASLARQSLNDEWEAAARECPDLDKYRSRIEDICEANNIDSPNRTTITTLYWAERGREAASGSPPPVSTPPSTNTPPNPPPQHPASRQPMNTQTQKKPIRQLDENERRLARESRMTDEEYLAWLDEDEEDIAYSKIGVKSDG